MRTVRTFLFGELEMPGWATWSSLGEGYPSRSNCHELEAKPELPGLMRRKDQRSPLGLSEAGAAPELVVGDGVEEVPEGRGEIWM